MLQAWMLIFVGCGKRIVLVEDLFRCAHCHSSISSGVHAQALRRWQRPHAKEDRRAVSARQGTESLNLPLLPLTFLQDDSAAEESERLTATSPARCAIRGSSSRARGYDSRWQVYTKAFLYRHPLCVDPFNRHPQFKVASQVVDHREPQPLRMQCHYFNTANVDDSLSDAR
jgi:hypothetical protein